MGETQAGGGAARTPSAEKIAELIEPLLGPAYGFCLRLTRNTADAEDLVQEAAMRACRSFSTWRPGTNFKAWFFKIVANLFYERFRRKRPEDSALMYEEAPGLYLFRQASRRGLLASSADPARELLARLDTAEIEAALMELPEEFRVVCNMYFIEDFTYEEIAEMLGIPIGTVRSRLHRGRKLLQKRLWEVAVDRGIVTGEGRNG